MARGTSAATVQLAKRLRREMSLPEVTLWQILRTRPERLKFRRQHPIGPFVADFYCPSAKTIFEIDGVAHGMGGRPTRDEARDRFLIEKGMRVLRIPASEVLKDVTQVAESHAALFVSSCETKRHQSAASAEVDEGDSLMIELAAGPWRAALRPEIGGCLASLDRDGVPILRTMAKDADHPLQSACFALVPYCNRIAEGRFTFGGRSVEIAPNLSPQRQPLHGLGWLAPWRTVRSDAASALLEHAHDGSDEWPWPYVAHQHVALDAAGVTVRLLVQNRASDAAPMGLGLHPYFRRSHESVVTLSAEAMLGIDAEFLPDGAHHPADALAPWSDGAPLPDRLVDNSFAGWSGSATIADAHGTITLRGFGAPHCHLYAPPGGEELCIEPVNHLPDALNRAPGEMPIVQPGCAAGIAMRIEASPPA